MKHFRPRNWEKFQHYGKRNPPWIKLHKSLLRDRDFGTMTVAQQLVCMKIWLLYAELGTALVWDCSWLGRNIDVDSNTVGKALPELLSRGFIELSEKIASTTLAECKQDASPETETETEIQTPTEFSAQSAPGAPPDDLKSRVFGAGLDWLADKIGRPDRPPRALVGKWCRDYGDGPTLEAMIAAQRASPVEPIGYIERLLKSGGPRGSPHSEARQAALEDQVDQMISKAAERADAQQPQTDHGPVGEAKFSFRAPDSEDHQRRAEPEVRRTGGGLRGISSALPALGTGGRH